jgi:glycosyltransferase 2 family protein
MAGHLLDDDRGIVGDLGGAGAMSLVMHGRERTQTAERADTTPGEPPAEPDERARPLVVHSPELLARLIVLVALFVVLGALARVLDRTFAGLAEDLSVLNLGLPGGASALVSAAAMTIAVLVVALALVASRGAGLRSVLTGALSGVAALIIVGGGLRVAVAAGWLRDTDLRPTVLAASALAVLTTQHEQVPGGLRRTAWWVLILVTMASTLGTLMPPGAQLLALVGGAAIGAAVGLAVGTPSRAPTGAAVRAGLERVGLRVDEVEPATVDARASVPWRARLATGRDVFVKTRSAEERSADLLFRMWRVIRLRDTDDGLPEASLRRAVEHEAFVASRAAAVGVRTPRLLAIGRLDHGVFAAYEAIAGETFADLGDAVTPAQLRAAWSMSQSMHRAGMAHRDLRVANLLVDDDGEVWIVDFGFAEVAASEAQQLHDKVELVASTASVVGVPAAVEAAVEVLGPAALAEALPYVQPAAVCAATRRALGKTGFDELHRALVEATGAPEPEAPRLVRVKPKTILTIAALGIAGWVLGPQVIQQGNLWGELAEAHRGWALLVLGAAALSYLGATVALVGAAPGSVPFLPAFASQVASSFTNRITPASVGGLALSTRFLARTGTAPAAAATAVGLSATAGAVVHVVLTVFALAWAGSAGIGDLTLPEPRTLVLTAGVVVGLVGAGLAVPAARHFLVDRLSGPVASSIDAVRAVASSPRHLVLLVGGSALVTLANLAALSLSLQALGATVALSALAVIYLAGAAVGSAAPTPGGLGALEAALVGGLVATSVDQSTALGAVLLFRLATFWLPILPGWLCFAALQRRGWL